MRRCFLALLTLCGGCKNSGTDPYVHFFDDPSNVENAFNAAIYPPSVVSWAAYYASTEDLTCPVVTLDGAGGWALDGGCESEGGNTYAGHAEGVGLTVSGWSPPFEATWDDWLRTSDLGTTTVAGEQTYDAATDAISSDLDILGGDQGEDFHFRYDGHVVSQMTGFLRYGTTWSLVTDMDFELAGEPYAIHAEGSGAFVDGCSERFGEGSLELTADADSATVSFDGFVKCGDGYSYTTAGGSSGSF
jgi:hypothetical protein